MSKDVTFYLGFSLFLARHPLYIMFYVGMILRMEIYFKM